MSKYKEIQTQFKTLDSLTAALRALKIPFEQATGQEKISLNGWGNQSRANVAIRRETLKAMTGNHFYADIGFTLDAGSGTYSIVADHLEIPVLTPIMNQIKQEYAAKEAVRIARLKGYRVTEKRVNGQIKLTLEK